MFDFFIRRKKTAPSGQPPNVPLAFKDGTAALEYAVKFMECSLQPGASLPAVVLDSRAHFGTKRAVKVQPDGNQVAVVRVASNDGGFVVLAATAGPRGPELQPGQLVAWQAMKYDHQLARAGEDERSGWVGLIVGTLQPEHRDGSWLGGDQFTPMAERFFNWEARPAVMRDTPAGGVEALFVPSGASAWSRAHPVEVLESGIELSRREFSEMFPTAPPVPKI